MTCKTTKMFNKSVCHLDVFGPDIEGVLLLFKTEKSPSEHFVNLAAALAFFWVQKSTATVAILLDLLKSKVLLALQLCTFTRL